MIYVYFVFLLIYALGVQVTDLKAHAVLVTKNENQTTLISKQKTAVRACQRETKI